MLRRFCMLLRINVFATGISQNPCASEEGLGARQFGSIARINAPK